MDKIPPHSIDAEQGLISAILVNPDRLDDVSYIKPEMFYNKSHAKIFEHIIKIARSGKHPDIVTVNSSLTQTGEIEGIGALYLTDIADKVVNDRYAEQHADIVKDNYLRRKYIQLSQELSVLSYDRFTEISELNNYAEKSFFDITENTIKNDPEVLSGIHQQTLEHINKIASQKTKLIGVPSGITELDRLTLGFQKSDLILIAARPSMGKTAFSLFISKNAAALGYKILFFSLEMSKRQLSYRLLADRFTEINDLKMGKDIDWPGIEKEAGGEYAGNIFVDDTPALKATEIRSIARKFKKKVDIDMVVVDYLQLARGDEDLKQNGNRYVGDISKTFKNTAKELDIPFVALSQLNRAVEGRGNPFPILSDLRESGELEQDADIVMFLTRFARLPEKHWKDIDGNDMREKAYIDVAKNRNGKCDKILTTASEDAMHWGYSETF
jgi:replicative DNA helicase